MTFAALIPRTNPTGAAIAAAVTAQASALANYTAAIAATHTSAMNEDEAAGSDLDQGDAR